VASSTATDIPTLRGLIRCARRWRGSTRRQSQPRNRKPRRQPKPTSGRGDNRQRFVADLAYKTKRLVEEAAMQDGLGRLTKSVTFDVKTLEALRGEKGPEEGKVFNLVRGLQKENRR
jgi:hypothetical protein